MLESEQFKSKIHFNSARGYDIVGIKYGLRLINNEYETLYFVCMPNQETSKVSRPIYAISRGASLSVKPDMADVNDVILVVGLYRNASDDKKVGRMSNNPKSTPHALPCELITSTLSALSKNSDLREFSELVKPRKPKLSQYLAKAKKVQIGKVEGTQAGLAVTQFGQT